MHDFEQTLPTCPRSGAFSVLGGGGGGAKRQKVGTGVDPSGLGVPTVKMLRPFWVPNIWKPSLTALLVWMIQSCLATLRTARTRSVFLLLILHPCALVTSLLLKKSVLRSIFFDLSRSHVAIADSSSKSSGPFLPCDFLAFIFSHKAACRLIIPSILTHCVGSPDWEPLTCEGAHQIAQVCMCSLC